MTARGFIVLALLATACDRPTEAECRKAVENIDRLTSADTQGRGHNPEAAVRSCRSRSSKAAVLCTIAAQTADELTKCEGSRK